jgi:hypothetical protein
MAARKKKQTQTKSLSSEDENVTDLSKLEQLSVDQLITQALARHKAELAADKKIKVKELGHLASLAEEYLNCFLLIGFSVQNEKVILQSMSTSKDEAALMDLLRTTFIELLGNRP